MTDSSQSGSQGPPGGPGEALAWKTQIAARLARGVGHNLRNQLTVIRGYCDLLLAQLPPDSELREEVGHIRSAADRAAAITGELLSLGRGPVLRPETFDLNEAVEEMRDSLGRMLGEGIVLSFAPDGRPCPVRADRSVLSQALVNLAVNAREAMLGGGELAIRTSATVPADWPLPVAGLEGGACVALSVADTGVGMDAPTRERAFEPFFTTKEPGRGTGLGLSLVQRFAADSGGCVLVTSRPGQGSTFTLVLPRAEPAEEAAGEDVEGARGTVLVVEDSEDVRQLIVRVLNRQGYDLLVADGGREALAAAGRAGTIDLLLTDVALSGLSGPELAQRLQAERPGLAVLFTVGTMDDPAGADLAESMGAKVLAKPFTPATLARAVREALAGRR
ncbi:MAG TPA: ATP-binding protein [Phycisphaerae bacterium]|nr:ATP-binding protein [Phycisphaerae bacterium]